jgi:hypothetical protein
MTHLNNILSLIVLLVGVSFFMIIVNAGFIYRKKNNIAKKVLLFISLISFVGYYLLFDKQKEYYIIPNIEVTLVQLFGDSTNGYIIYPYDKKNKTSQLGVKIIVRKEYLSDKNSKVYLSGGSMEPGIEGIVNPINRFAVLLKKNGQDILLSDSLMAKYNSKPDCSKLGDALCDLYRNGFSLAHFIQDINKNAKYTKGMAFDNSEIYFWLSKNEVESLEIDKFQILLEGESKNLNIHKVLIDY